MSIRHFRRVGPAVLKEATQEQTSIAISDATIEADSRSHQSGESKENEEISSEEGDSSENSSESEDDSSSSSEDEEITYHKPVFLKKKKVQPLPSEEMRVTREAKKKQSERRVQHSLNVSRNVDINKINIDENYTTTDKDLLKRTIELNDDDTIDPEGERTKWETRQETRLKRERQVLVAKQLEVEERQERHLKRSVPLKADATSIKDNSTSIEHKRFKQTINYKPQRVQSTNFNTELPSTTIKDPTVNDDSKNNEFSIL